MMDVIIYSFENETINGCDKHSTQSRVDLYFSCFSYLLKHLQAELLEETCNNFPSLLVYLRIYPFIN